MAAPALNELLTVPTVQQIYDGELAPVLRANGVRVSDWLVGGVYRALAFGVSTFWQEGRTAIATLTAGGFGDYVFGFKQAPSGVDLSTWVTPYAKGVYGIDRIQATNTIRTITFVNLTATTYGPIAAGGMTLSSTTTGNRYKNVSSLTIAASGNTTALFQSEYTVNSSLGRTYNDAPYTVWNIVTAQYPGVVPTNPPTTFSSVASVAAGTGTVTPSGTPPTAHSIAIRVDTAGVIGGGAWSVSLDGGPFLSQGVIGTLVNFSATGITITPANGTGTPSFPAGALFYFNNPGSDLVQAGRDLETPGALGARCYALYPSLSSVQDSFGNWIPKTPTMSAYQAMAFLASTQVKVAFAKTDATINDKINIVVAGQGAILPSGVIAIVQAFFNSFTSLTDVPVVSSPTTNAITLGGATINYSSGASNLTAAQTALTLAIGNYLSGVDSGSPLNINGLVDRSYLNKLLRSAPFVTHVNDGLTINTVAADLQLPTSGTYGLATWDGVSANPVSTAFTWVAV